MVTAFGKIRKIHAQIDKNIKNKDISKNQKGESTRVLTEMLYIIGMKIERFINNAFEIYRVF